MQTMGGKRLRASWGCEKWHVPEYSDLCKIFMERVVYPASSGVMCRFISLFILVTVPAPPYTIPV